MSGPPAPRRRRRGRRALLQLLAVVAVFALLEGVLALAGVQPLAATEDPYVGFSGAAPRASASTWPSTSAS